MNRCKYCKHYEPDEEGFGWCELLKSRHIDNDECGKYEEDKPGDEMFKIIRDSLESMTKQTNNTLDYALRNLVIPPIKGEITKGKIRWRGLWVTFSPSELTMEKDGDKMVFKYSQKMELWQRDKQII